MSFYTSLSTPVPTIAYSILHQAANGHSTEDYEATIRELHARLAEETGTINAAYTKFLRETLAREAQMLRGSLSQFLETPIRSDNAEVQRIFADSHERIKNQLLDNYRLGITSSSEGKIFVPTFKRPGDRKLVQNGKTYLRDLGFVLGKNAGEVYESVFVVLGGLNLDVLEHLVRDKLGIYDTTHGKHLRESNRYVFTAYNLVYSKGAMPNRQSAKGYVETTFCFSKPDIKYAPFRSGLVEAMDALGEKITIDHLSLWQRKLGLGRGREFVLRCVCDFQDKAEEITKFLRDYRGHEAVMRTLAEDAQLLTKELLS